MKSFFIAVLLFASIVLSMGAEMTNGVFYVNNNVECHLIAQNGATETNQLIAGKTYMVGNVLLEFPVSKATIFYFSGGPIVKASDNSVLSIHVFDQEVNNLDATPRKATFGAHNLSLEFNSGEFVMLYPNNDGNSSLIIATQFSSYQLSKGKYYFRVSDKSAIVYVVDGIMNVYGSTNKVDSVQQGNMSLSIPDPLTAKVLNNNNVQFAQDKIDQFTDPVKNAERTAEDVQFIVINGRVVGVLLK